MRLHIRPVRAIVCVVLGAITTVLVAWGIAITPHPVPDSWIYETGRETNQWYDVYAVQLSPDGDERWHLVMMYERFGFSFMSIHPGELYRDPAPNDEMIDLKNRIRGPGANGVIPKPSPRREPSIVWTLLNRSPNWYRRGDARRYGFPMRAMWEGEATPERADAGFLDWRPQLDTVTRGRLTMTDPRTKTQHHLPIAILPIGFTVDSLCSSVVYYILLCLPGVVRHHYRRKQSRCVVCGYDRSGTKPNALCPECGRI
ncbi:MAG: hypothetical protein H6815_03740 [Phycisphaeraceae bacterium]|nr:hypothetical protein [Phycisphaerales bacterium]MCB9859541.1 hypothetical protein [Phycisphaeraceae bacterium]